MTAPLERRYRWLMRSYPSAYRQERAEEMVSTLLQLARPGQRRPTVRETTALILGGLRTRAGVHRRHSSGAVWLSALHLAVLLLLADGAASGLAQSIRVVVALGAYPHPPTVMDWAYLLSTLLVCAALPVAAAGRRSIALGLTLLAIVTQHWAPDNATMNDLPLISGVLWQLVLAAALTIPLLRRHPPASPHPTRWLIAVPIALIIMPTQLPAVFGPRSWTWILFSHQWWLLVAGVLASLLYGLADARAPIAAGALMLVLAAPVLVNLALYGPDRFAPHELAIDALVWGFTAAVPLAAGTLGAHRQGRL